MGTSVKEVQDHLQQLVSLLTSLGFLINWEKSVLAPNQVMEFLGFLVDSRTLSLSIPQL